MICSASVLLSITFRPNYAAVCIFAGLLAFGAGGNLVLDVTVFLEYLPSNKQHVLTLLAGWWGVGQTFTGFMAWAFCWSSYLIHAFTSCLKADLHQCRSTLASRSRLVHERPTWAGVMSTGRAARLFSS